MRWLLCKYDDMTEILNILSVNRPALPGLSTICLPDVTSGVVLSLRYVMFFFVDIFRWRLTWT